MIDEPPNDAPLYRSVRVTQRRGSEVALHAHDESQLIYAAAGTIQVHTASGRWLVPPSLAVWIPTRVPHLVEVISDAKLWLIYWQPAGTDAWAPLGLMKRAFALHVTPLLRELLDIASVSELSSLRAELAVRLTLQELTAVDDAPTYLPLPMSAIGRRIAMRILADPCGQRSLDDIAGEAATSARTVSRLFPAETGQTFKTWRQRARIVFAIERLASGAAITQVARETGFASPAAFAYAFRQMTSATPTEFQRANGAAGRASSRGKFPRN